MGSTNTHEKEKEDDKREHQTNQQQLRKSTAIKAFPLQWRNKPKQKNSKNNNKDTREAHGTKEASTQRTGKSRKQTNRYVTSNRRIIKGQQQHNNKETKRKRRKQKSIQCM